MTGFDAAAIVAGIRVSDAELNGDSDRPRIDHEKQLLRVRAAARDELAFESVPALPVFTPGVSFLAQADTSPVWRVDGLWPAGGNVMLAAQFKAGKTTLRDNLIRSWCDFAPFLGCHPVTPGGTLAVIDAEMPAPTARRWLNAQMISAADRFTYCNIRGMASSFNICVPRIRLAWAEHLSGCSALLLDCLGPVLAASGLDENSAADVGRWLAALETLLAEAGLTESMVILHMGHGGERSRGASRLRDWPDAEWRVIRGSDNPASPRYLSAFGRDVDLPESRLLFDPATRHLSLDGGSRVQTAATEAQDALLALLDTEDGLSYRAIERALTPAHPVHSIRDAIKSAEADGCIRITDGPRNSKLHHRLR
jgi:hypothetical protein